MNTKTKYKITNKKVQSKKHLKAQNIFGSKWYLEIFGIAIIILLGLIIYSNSYDCSFHFDDRTAIEENNSIRDLGNIKAIYHGNDHSRFIPYLTFAINYHYDKLNVWGYHLYNLMIHLLNACLVGWLVLLLFSTPILKTIPLEKNKKVIAFITALLFVSHPLATQSVTYIVQRAASLAALFYFLSIALYLKARLMKNGYGTKYILFFGCFCSIVLAMLSKENAYTLPIMIVLVEFFFLQTKRFSINLKDYRIYLVLMLMIGFVVFVFFKFSFDILKPISPNYYNDYRTITSQNYLFTQFTVVIKYIQLLLIPINQNFDYDFALSNGFFETRTILSFLFLIFLLALGIYLFYKNRINSFCIFWFFITISIESSFIPISDVIVEHRTYLPSFGIFLLLSTLIYTYLRNKYLVVTFFAVIIISNAVLTFERNKVWKNGITFWSDAIEKSPNKARCYSERGIVYFHENKNKEAFINFNKALELKPNDSKAYNARGSILAKEKKYNEALLDFDRAIDLNPNYPNAYYNRGLTKLNLRKKDDGCKDLLKASSLGYRTAKELHDKVCNK